MVESDSINTESLINAMESGKFYATSGIYLKKVIHTKNRYTIEVDSQSNVNYEIIFYGYKKNTESVIELSRSQSNKATYAIENDDIFVRAKIISDQKISNPYKEGETASAWTQPILLPWFYKIIKANFYWLIKGSFRDIALANLFSFNSS